MKTVKELKEMLESLSDESKVTITDDHELKIVEPNIYDGINRMVFIEFK